MGAEDISALKEKDMITEKFRIDGIPAILWGKESSKWMIAAHGSHSSKIDDCIWILAEEAQTLGYQVLSFDFPRHGERVYETRHCMVQQCVRELAQVMEYARKRADHISVFGCSMGAYFSLLAYGQEKIERALFLSPVTDMERVIQNTMRQFQVSEERLREEKVIETPFEPLIWDYYCYIKEHPVLSWNHPTSILYGEHDAICEYEYVSAFAKKNHCHLEVQPGGEHWFHTKEELAYYRDWLRRRL